MNIVFTDIDHHVLMRGEKEREREMTFASFWSAFFVAPVKFTERIWTWQLPFNPLIVVYIHALYNNCDFC